MSDEETPVWNDGEQLMPDGHDTGMGSDLGPDVVGAVLGALSTSEEAVVRSADDGARKPGHRGPEKQRREDLGPRAAGLLSVAFGFFVVYRIAVAW